MKTEYMEYLHFQAVLTHITNSTGRNIRILNINQQYTSTERHIFYRHHYRQSGCVQGSNRFDFLQRMSYKPNNTLFYTMLFISINIVWQNTQSG